MGLQDREWYHKQSELNVKRLLDEAEKKKRREELKSSIKSRRSDINSKKEKSNVAPILGYDYPIFFKIFNNTIS